MGSSKEENLNVNPEVFLVHEIVLSHSGRKWKEKKQKFPKERRPLIVPAVTLEWTDDVLGKISCHPNQRKLTIHSGQAHCPEIRENRF